jgi:hypothetical protein
MRDAVIFMTGDALDCGRLGMERESHSQANFTKQI